MNKPSHVPPVGRDLVAELRASAQEAMNEPIKSEGVNAFFKHHRPEVPIVVSVDLPDSAQCYRVEQEYRFFCTVQSLCHLLHSAPWLYVGFTGLLLLEPGTLFDNWPCVWRIAVACLIGWIHHGAVKNETGLYRGLAMWEQSILRRREWLRLHQP